MKVATVKVVTELLENQIKDIGYKIISNRREIKALALKQASLKRSCSALYEIIRKLKEDK